MCISAVQPPRHISGFTLIELIMFIVIVGVALAGVVSVMNVGVRSSADPVVRKQALSMAEAIMDEVLAREFANPAGGFTETNTTCANRAQYDDVSDYDCFKTSSTNRILGDKTLGATPIPALASYSASVDIDATTAKLGLVAGTQVKTVTVTVSRGQDSIQLIGYRTNY